MATKEACNEALTDVEKAFVKCECVKGISRIKYEVRLTYCFEGYL
jgi:hypothetical protein